jgi:hypothetical protein
MTQVPYQGHTDVRHHHTKLVATVTWHLGFEHLCFSLFVSFYKFVTISDTCSGRNCSGNMCFMIMYQDAILLHLENKGA